MADCLAAVVHHAEEGWRKGMGAQGMFQIGLVEQSHSQALMDDALWRQALCNVVRGGRLTPAEEDRLRQADDNQPFLR